MCLSHPPPKYPTRLLTTSSQAALSSHPDKVSEDQRAEAEVKFKSISQAYEILFDDQKRDLYDQYGMAAFDTAGPGAGPPGGVDDLLAQMFGMNMGGAGPSRPGGPRRSRRGEDEEQQYEVTLEELYKGKTTHFSSTKNVICTVCTGTGGKPNTKPKTCDTCKGAGTVRKLVQVGPGLVTQTAVACGTCNGNGTFFKEKERCKKCKGARVVETKKKLELYIPPGSREGEKIVLKGEADQHPDQEPGDIVFHLVEAPHKIFKRAGADLAADLEITLAEALTGFNRVVLTHLDGRGISLKVEQPEGKILRPEEVLRVEGEGMPHKRSDAKGDLYLIVKIEFPDNGWIKDDETVKTLREMLPPPEPLIKAREVDEVEFEADVDLEDFGGDSDDPRARGAWEDDEDGAQGAQCAQQ